MTDDQPDSAEMTQMIIANPLRRVSLLLIGILLSQWPSAADGFLTPSAREWAMGGSYVAVARGIESEWTNPANLGLPGGGGFSLSLISLSTGVGNNSFSLDQYNRYTSGIKLSESDKQDILDAIPSDGWEARADLGMNALGFSVGRGAFAAVPRLSASMGVTRDYFDLVLRGNELDRVYSLKGNSGEGFAAVEIGGAYAFPIEMSWAEHFSVGVGVKHLVGFAYGEIVESSGEVVTTPGVAQGVGRVKIRYAGNTRFQGDDEEFDLVQGHGWALDLGAAAVIKEGWVVSFVLKDLSGGITWPAYTERSYEFTADSLTVDSADDGDLIETDDYVETGGRFSSPYPGALRLGVMHERGWLLLAADYEQGFKNFAGRSTTPRISAGAEARPVHWLPLRTGLTMGGGMGVCWGWGTGLDLGPFAMDLALRNRGVTPGGSKGLSFAFSTRLDF